MTEVIAALPKVELHLHLEGSLRPATLFHLAERNDVALPASDPGELEAMYVYESFDDFLRLFLTGLEVMRSADDFADVAAALAEELSAQNVRYAEVTTTPYNHHRRGIPIEEYVEGLNEGRRRAARAGVEIAWVCDIPRELEDPDLGYTADFVTSATAPDGVVALGLGGPEPGFPPARWASSFSAAKAAGLGAVPHSGETAGPEAVWSAIHDLRADRIGHGVTSIEDHILVEHLASNQIPLEVSVSSNVALGVVDSVADHPLPDLLAAGVAVTINTDDPAYFMTDLTTELLLVMDAFKLDTSDIISLQRAALDHSFAPAQLRSDIAALIDAAAAQVERAGDGD